MSCSRNSLPFGQDTLVTEGTTYRIGEAQITIIRIAIRYGVDEIGHENEYLDMQVRIGNKAFSLTDDKPVEMDGLIFSASAVGYRRGVSPATATLRINEK